MENVLNLISSFPTVIYTVPLVVCLVFWLFGMLGLFDVDFLDIDRPLYPDHTAMKELVRSCEILEDVEDTVGSLG